MYEEDRAEKQDQLSEDFFDSLSVRPYNCLIRAGIRDAVTLTHMTRYELGRLQNLGKKSQEEVIKAMHALNLYLKDELNDEPDDDDQDEDDSENDVQNEEESSDHDQEIHKDPRLGERKVSLLQLLQKVKNKTFPMQVMFRDRVYTWDGSDYVCQDGFRTWTLLSGFSFGTRISDAVTDEKITELSDYNIKGLTKEEVEYVEVLSKIAGKTPDRVIRVYKGYRGGIWKLVIVFDDGGRYECDFDPTVFRNVPIRNSN